MIEPTLEQVIENQQNVIELWAKKNAELEQRLADVESELDELDKELFIFAHDVMCFENDKIPDWVFEKAKAIYGRLCLGKGGVMSDIPDTNDINKLAAWFDKDTLELIGHILNKHTKACLSQMKELVIERKELKKRLAAAEAKNTELEKELFILASDVVYCGCGHVSAGLQEKAKRIYGKLRESGSEG